MKLTSRSCRNIVGLQFLGLNYFIIPSSYQYRQASDFWYLTGFEEPNAAVILGTSHPDLSISTSNMHNTSREDFCLPWLSNDPLFHRQQPRKSEMGRRDDFTQRCYPNFQIRRCSPHIVILLPPSVHCIRKQEESLDVFLLIWLFQSQLLLGHTTFAFEPRGSEETQVRR